jgi:hypothetical protein
MDQTVVPAGIPVIFRTVNEGSLDRNLILEKNGAIDEPLLDAEGNPVKIVSGSR